MPKPWQGDERRSHPRVSLNELDKKSSATVLESAIVDLSLSGALLEVPSRLPAKSRYLLRVTFLDAAPLELPGEVVRSYVHGFEKDDRGLPRVKYRAAVQFIDLTPDKLRELEKLVRASDDLARKTGIAG